jgi:hypothetical protein
MKKLIIIVLSLTGLCACQVTEDMNTDNNQDAIRLQCMLTSDDSDPVHYLYLDRFYAIKSGQYYRQQPEPIRPFFSVESNGKSVQVVEDASLSGRYILQGEFNHGDEIAIHISGDGVSEVSSATTIPETPTKDNIENLFIKETTIDGGIVVISTYRVSFILTGDDAYYGLSFVLGEGADAYEVALVPDGKVDVIPGEAPEFSTAFPTSAPILRLSEGKVVTRGAKRSMYVMSGLVSKESSPIKITSEFTVFLEQSVKPHVRLYRLTEEAYQACMREFANSNNDLEGLGLTSPATVWTNVKGGQGYFCGYSFRDYKY